MGSTTQEIVASFTASGLETVLYSIGAVLTIAVILVGVGYGWRLFTRRVTGRKI